MKAGIPDESEHEVEAEDEEEEETKARAAGVDGADPPQGHSATFGETAFGQAQHLRQQALRRSGMSPQPRRDKSGRQARAKVTTKGRTAKASTKEWAKEKAKECAIFGKNQAPARAPIAVSPTRVDTPPRLNPASSREGISRLSLFEDHLRQVVWHHLWPHQQ